MIMWVRTALGEPGKFGELMAFATEASAYAKSKQALEVRVMLQQGGPVGRVCWSAEYKSLAAYEETTTKILADPEYQKLLQKAAGVLVPGQINDSLWRVI